MRYLRFVLVALLWIASGCADEEPRTQITFKISASDALVAQIAELGVAVRSAQGADQDKTFPRNELDKKWPIEIVVIPKLGNRSSYEVEVTVTAYDATHHVLATAQAKKAFSPRKHVPVSLPLDGEPVPNEGADAGQDAAPSSMADAGRDARAEGGSEQMDARPDEPANCATRASEITCNDGNACNGGETCDPSSGAADSRGCLPGTPIVCAVGMTCDAERGMCSRCATTRDGDGDGVASSSCEGTDCNDADPDVAPGKGELCDGKDNDCNGFVDGTDADSACADKAPSGGTASCVSAQCVRRCNNSTFQIEGDKCVAPPVSCPVPNPCTPGSCASGADSYTCTCPTGYRAGIGMTRCAPRGVAKRTVGFETSCDGTPTPGTFDGEFKEIAANLYATCGVASITTGGLSSKAQLIAPQTTVIDGITGQAALAGGAVTGMTVATEDLVLAFSPGVNEVTFDVLDLDNPTGLRVVFEAAGGAALPALEPPLVTGTKRAHVTQQSTTPIERATLHYTQAAAGDAWFLDALTIDVWGCGDGETEMPAGEACDDGNDVQCDGCDNACAASLSGCQRGNACVAAAPTDGGLCAP